MVKVYTTLNQGANDESWGVRQLNIFLALCPENCSTCTAASPTACLSCSGTYVLNEGKCVPAQQNLLVDKDFTD